jgi:hypothetical protein
MSNDGRWHQVQMQREIADKLGHQTSANNMQSSMKRPTFVLHAFFALILINAAHAADDTLPGVMTDAQLLEQGFAPLVESDSLDAWRLQPWHKGHWTLVDGVINYDGKARHKDHNELSLWTKKDFGDIQLYVEWRLPAKPRLKRQPIVLYNGDFLLDDAGKRITRQRLDAGDSGILLRGTSKCQANIWSQELGSGEINGYRTDRKMPPDVRRACIPMKNADRPFGEWNAFRITMQGDHMTVDLNGERVIDAARLPGVPKAGPIGLQHHGDTVQFRQIWVKDLN